MTKRYFTDHWTLDDDLGMAGTGDQLARMTLEADTPFSIRVTGKWGSGKTSVLRRAFATLGGRPVQQALPLGENREEYDAESWNKWACKKRESKLKWPENLYDIAEKSLCVWYSPWQHQNADNPLVPLLLEIREQFGAVMKFKEKAGEFNRRGGLAAMALLERVTDAACMLTLGKNTKIAGTTEAVRKAWKEAEPNLAEPSDGQRFHLLFEDAVENALLSLPGVDKDALDHKRTRLIVFIDDLDRCEEAIVVNLLESIKLYLGSHHCVFVLGMDDTAVLGAMKRFWQPRSDDDNREYLEKMFQVTLTVPLPKPLKIQDVVAKHLENHGFGSPKECAVVIENLIEPNPRKIKNFCNSLCAAWDLFGGARFKHIRFECRFIIYHYLRLFHRPVWRILERQPRALAVLYKVLAVSSDPVTLLKDEDQRVLRELFSRAFMHVLREGPDERGFDPHFHRLLGLDQAVALFEQRLDSKRSDELFVSLFIKLTKPNRELHSVFLYLPEEAQDV